MTGFTTFLSYTLMFAIINNRYISLPKIRKRKRLLVILWYPIPKLLATIYATFTYEIRNYLASSTA